MMLRDRFQLMCKSSYLAHSSKTENWYSPVPYKIFTIISHLSQIFDNLVLTTVANALIWLVVYCQTIKPGEEYRNSFLHSIKAYNVLLEISFMHHVAYMLWCFVTFLGQESGEICC
jgi:hypothetical protein